MSKTTEYIIGKRNQEKKYRSRKRLWRDYLPKIQYYLEKMNESFANYMEHEEVHGQQGYHWRQYLLNKNKHDYFVDKQIKL